MYYRKFQPSVLFLCTHVSVCGVCVLCVCAHVCACSCLSSGWLASVLSGKTAPSSPHIPSQATQVFRSQGGLPP